MNDDSSAAEAELAEKTALVGLEEAISQREPEALCEALCAAEKVFPRLPADRPELLSAARALLAELEEAARLAEDATSRRWAADTLKAAVAEDSWDAIQDALQHGLKAGLAEEGAPILAARATLDRLRGAKELQEAEGHVRQKQARLQDLAAREALLSGPSHKKERSAIGKEIMSLRNSEAFISARSFLKDPEKEKRRRDEHRLEIEKRAAEERERWRRRLEEAPVELAAALEAADEDAVRALLIEAVRACMGRIMSVCLTATWHPAPAFRIALARYPHFAGGMSLMKDVSAALHIGMQRTISRGEAFGDPSITKPKPRVLDAKYCNGPSATLAIDEPGCVNPRLAKKVDVALPRCHPLREQRFLVAGQFGKSEPGSIIRWLGWIMTFDEAVRRGLVPWALARGRGARAMAPSSARHDGGGPEVVPLPCCAAAALQGDRAKAVSFHDDLRTFASKFRVSAELRGFEAVEMKPMGFVNQDALKRARQELRGLLDYHFPAPVEPQTIPVEPQTRRQVRLRVDGEHGAGMDLTACELGFQVDHVEYFSVGEVIVEINGRSLAALGEEEMEDAFGEQFGDGARLVIIRRLEPA
ncbi:unnamed protein product [Polarella glacialis]|uniref:PDZ domain-containing protein n=1 Tax=Polarella glacialis TaxID=89957 RepID=A0A813H324_POLGL|nr:unnamed protein product [Polarella glacialis]